jgi:hypothetical protein
MNITNKIRLCKIAKDAFGKIEMRIMLCTALYSDFFSIFGKLLDRQKFVDWPTKFFYRGTSYRVGVYCLSFQRTAPIFGVADPSSSSSIDSSLSIDRGLSFHVCSNPADPRRHWKLKSLVESTAEQCTAPVNGRLTSGRRKERMWGLDHTEHEIAKELSRKNFVPVVK